MKSRSIFIVIIILVFITALITNPSKEEFVDYIEVEFVNDAEGEVDKLIRSITKGIIATVADNAKRTNYLVFSKFELGDQTYIGLFGQFRPLN